MSLNANQAGFVDLMAKSAEAEDDGFTILAKRDDAHLFFDVLVEKELLSPSKIQGPVPADREGYFRLPYWHGLDYIETVARGAGARKDEVLAAKIASLILTLSRGVDDTQRQNYHVWRKLSEAIAYLPLSVISKELIDQVKSWLQTKLDRSLVAEALGNRLLPQLIKSDGEGHRRLAVELFGLLTGLSQKSTEEGADDYDTDVESYWVTEIVKRNLAAFVEREPRLTADLFRSRVKQVFSGRRAKSSWLYRPAVEDHAQNMDWHAAENFTVSGLRDILCGWAPTAPEEVKAYVESLFRDGEEMERRIAISVFDQQFELLRDAASALLTPAFVDVGTIHESYNFLVHRGASLTQDELNRVLAAIDAIDIPIEGEDDDGRNERLKQRWLSALVAGGVNQVEPAYRLLRDKYGSEGDHPDFLSYHESSYGPGPSPYSKAELLGFLLEGTLQSKLKGFEEPNTWRGPSTRALCDVLEEAVVENPSAFLAARRSFLTAGRGYQYAYLSGYLRAWANDKTKPIPLDWPMTWAALFDWVLAIIGPESFWSEEVEATVNLSPNKNWLIGQVAEMVEACTRDDAHAAPPALLPAVRNIVSILLERVETEPLKVAKGAVNHVINTHRGKTIEGLVNYALRQARLVKADEAAKAAIWAADLQPLFDAEIARIAAGNHEFVVLFGQYLPQFQFLCSEWLEKNIERVFRPGTLEFGLALAGTAYAQNTRPLYRLLAKSGIVDAALALPDSEEGGRERLVERMAVALLWGEEKLEGDRIVGLFEKGLVNDIYDMANLFWTARREGLSQSQVETVRSFWRSAADWSLRNETFARRLATRLLSLLSYFDSLAEPADQARVLALLKFTASDDHSWFLADEFDRLADGQPEFVGKAVLTYISTAKPFYDHDNHLLNATRKVWKARHPELAMEIVEKMRSLPAFRNLFLEMRGG